MSIVTDVPEVMACAACGKERPCIPFVALDTDGRFDVCQECVSLAYAAFLCADAENDPAELRRREGGEAGK